MVPLSMMAVKKGISIGYGSSVKRFPFHHNVREQKVLKRQAAGAADSPQRREAGCRREEADSWMKVQPPGGSPIVGADTDSTVGILLPEL
jgi:hypothetical protein